MSASFICHVASVFLVEEPHCPVQEPVGNRAGSVEHFRNLVTRNPCPVKKCMCLDPVILLLVAHVIVRVLVRINKVPKPYIVREVLIILGSVFLAKSVAFKG